MYGFELHYYSRLTDETFTKLIEVEEQLYDSEKEIYLVAMSRAYDFVRELGLDYGFDALEFIYC